MTMSPYNREQLEAIWMVRDYLRRLSRAHMGRLKRRIRSYLLFRSDVDKFQRLYFSEVCSEKCFTSQTSACCGREGIATFFADVVINGLLSSEEETDALLQALSRDSGGFKCVYLTGRGCLWRLKPIVCEMFLCEYAKESVLAEVSGVALATAAVPAMQNNAFAVRMKIRPSAKAGEAKHSLSSSSGFTERTSIVGLTAAI